jgi:hypothetical protein
MHDFCAYFFVNLTGGGCGDEFAGNADELETRTTHE